MTTVTDKAKANNEEASKDCPAVTNCAIKAIKGGCIPIPVVTAAAGDGNGATGHGSGKVGEAIVVTVKGIEVVKKNSAKAFASKGIAFYEAEIVPGGVKASTKLVVVGIGPKVGGVTCVASESAGTKDATVKLKGLLNVYNSAKVITVVSVETCDVHIAVGECGTSTDKAPNGQPGPTEHGNNQS